MVPNQRELIGYSFLKFICIIRKQNTGIVVPFSLLRLNLLKVSTLLLQQSLADLKKYKETFIPNTTNLKEIIIRRMQKFLFSRGGFATFTLHDDFCSPSPFSLSEYKWISLRPIQWNAISLLYYPRESPRALDAFTSNPTVYIVKNWYCYYWSFPAGPQPKNWMHTRLLYPDEYLRQLWGNCGRWRKVLIAVNFESNAVLVTAWLGGPLQCKKLDFSRVTTAISLLCIETDPNFPKDHHLLFLVDILLVPAPFLFDNKVPGLYLLKMKLSKH